ncbi:MAG TPA: thioesterase [Flavobacteriales bacterium]|nr:thioesterase [Flavobacteriales bacterium]|tara:strand:+ start:701 stop:1114 length:414 start_codon:yes stop_codon:yes gene_type:complete
MDAKSNYLRSVPTIADAIGLEVLEISEEQVKGRLPVDHRTHQPYGLLHGGASVVLAETLGSVGSHFLVADQNKVAVGVEVNANHVRSVRSGWVYGVATLIHKGGKMHVWGIDIRDEAERLVCTSRLSVMIINQPNKE